MKENNAQLLQESKTIDFKKCVFWENILVKKIAEIDGFGSIESPHLHLSILVFI